MKKMKSIWLLALIILVILPVSAATFQNPSFEWGNANGWTLGDPDGVGYPEVNTTYHQQGAYSLKLNGHNNISQNITAGTENISFWYYGIGNNFIDVYIGTQVYEFQTTTDGIWHQWTADVSNHSGEDISVKIIAGSSTPPSYIDNFSEFYEINESAAVIIGDSVIRGAAAYSSRMDTAPNGWNPTYTPHSGTLAGEFQNYLSTSKTWYNNAIGGDVSGVPGSNGALSNQPEGVRNRFYRDALGYTDETLGDSPRPTKTLQNTPEIVIVGVGINDCAYNGSSYGGYAWTIDTTRTNIYWMATETNSKGIKSIFVVPAPAAGYCSLSYQTELRSWMLNNLSEITRVYDTWTLLNDGSGYTKAEYAADNVHMNDAGWTLVSYDMYLNNRDYLDPSYVPISSFGVVNSLSLNSGKLIVPITPLVTINNTALIVSNADTGESYTSIQNGNNIELSKAGDFANGQYNLRLQYSMVVYIIRGIV